MTIIDRSIILILMNATHNEPAATLIEDVVPEHQSALSRIDAWRWFGVLGFNEYLSHVLAREAERASRNVNV